ncbi:MAG: YihA family ribosome biogenesis GTP-binding protein [Bdellovibrionaceae bacterium]|nr:YihA family ribosome biogenesis GTP-binding protein [Pseudobdellovibrionaceae bacterium]
MTFVKYIKSAVLAKDYPITEFSEVAFVGRSNAGKSSLINSIANQKIAHVSGTPGKTRLLSFFNFNNEFVLVDMPGYGFAERSQTEQEDWKLMIESYLKSSQKLRCMVLVMDIRRSWADEEQMIKEFSEHLGVPLIVVFTKVDKLSRSQITKRLKDLNAEVDLKYKFPVSSLKKDGVEDLKKQLYKFLKKRSS